MRLGLVIASGDEAAAAEAEGHGLFGVLVSGTAGSECIAGAYAAAVTEFARIIVRVHIGSEHPITLAEEVSILDNACGGRVVVMADVSKLDAGAAIEDVMLLRWALSSTPIRHAGARWTVPAGLPEHKATASVIVTPPPVQVQVPVWVIGGPSASVSEALGVPVVRTEPGSPGVSGALIPGLVALTGNLEADRTRVQAWADAGVSHLLLDRSAGGSLDDVSRYLQPEVGMVRFPRVIADAALPMEWQGTPTIAPASTGH